MKKRILALLLAGLLTASLASCVTSKDRTNPGNDTVNGTEEYQTRGEEVTDTPTPVTWVDVDETVYVTASSMTLIGVEDASNTLVVKQIDKLQRIKMGTNKKDIVVKDGVQYYADNSKLTNEDLLGETMTACAKTTMYANCSVNIRKYASANYTFTETGKSFKLNDTVTVIAKGEKWSKIEYTDNGTTVNYFIINSALSDKQVVDPNTVDYSAYFTACEPTVKYVTATALNLRVNADADPNVTVLAVLPQGTEVKVIATGTVNGIHWSKVWAAKDVQEGQSPENWEGYVSSAYISDNVNGTSSMTLSEMLAMYENFTATETAQTMYVLNSAGSLNVRTTPELPADNANRLQNGLVAKDAVKVVATGQGGEVFWAMIEYAEGEYYFVSYKYLTTDPNGEEAPPSLDQLLATYTDFKACTETTVYAKGSVNCNSFPGNDDEISRKLASGEAVTLVAKGDVKGIEWYLIKTSEGAYYFAGASLFTDSNAAG